MIKVGDKAPEMTLWSSALEEVTIADHLGVSNVVISFFPLAFTGICTEQMCHYRDNMAAYEGLNATVYGMSVDSPFTLHEFAKKEGYAFPLLSDFNKEILPQFDALATPWVPQKWSLNGAAKRGAVVIDKAGIVRHLQVNDGPGDLPDFDALQAALAELADEEE